MLKEHREKKLLLLNASIGYGKTVLLSHHLQNVDTYAWISCHPDMQDIKVFLYYFISSFTKITKGFGTNCLEYLNSSEKFYVSDFLTIFINEFEACFTRNIILVIDDLHLVYENIAQPTVTDFIQQLLDETPHFLKIIISTRYSLPFETGKLKAKRNLWEINTNDLKVTDDELLDASREIYSKALKENEVKELQIICSGWITAVHVILQKTGETDITGLVPGQKEIDSYITEDFFNTLPEDIQKFLLRTAHMDTLRTDILSQAGIKDSAEVLKILYDKNIFLEELAGEEYIYQKLFKNFLLEKQKTYFKPDELAQILSQSAEIYCKRKSFLISIELYIKAGKFEKAMEVMYISLDNLLSDGLVIKCSELASRLSEKFGLTSPILNYINALLNIKYLGDIHKAENILEAYTYGDNKLYDEIDIKLLILKAESLLLSRNYDEAEEILKKVLALKLDLPIAIEANYLLGRIYFRKGQAFYPHATALLEQFIESDVSNSSDQRFANIFNLLGNINNDSGKFIQAAIYYQKVIALKIDEMKRLKVINNLVTSLSYTSQFYKAYEMIVLSDNICRRIPIKSNIVSNLKAREIFLHCSGDLEGSISHNTRLVKEYQTSKDTEQTWIYSYTIAESNFYAGRVNDAVQYLESNSGLLKELPPYCHKLYKYLSARLNKKVSDEVFLDILNFYTELNIVHIISFFTFVLADVYLRKNEHLSCLNKLSDALKSAKTLSYKYFLLNEIPVSRAVFDFAIASGIEKKFIFSLYEEFRDKQNYPWISIESRKRITSEIEKLTDIKFLPFGNTEFNLRGEVVDEDKWIRKKSKILLAYLMSDPERIYTKDKIMDIFFDDMPADKADVAYHSAIYNIRTALKIYDLKSDKPKRSKDKTYDYNPQYLLYEDKTLKLNPDFYYSAGNIEFEKHFGKAKLPSTSKEEKIAYSVKAVEMYKGDFMPGYYDSWCEELRVKYKNLYITLCEDLIKLFETEARYEEVIKYSGLLLNEDKFNDSTHISIINAYSKLGNINMAKSLYELMLKLYDEELGEQPHRKTLEKINTILKDK